MPSKKNKSFHVILSPRDCPKADRLVAWLRARDCRYVVAYELGTNGHQHIDAFVEFPQMCRQDNLRRDILNLYPNIPEEEHKNIKVVVNTLDTDTRYGFGYSLKEGLESFSNLSIDDMEDSLQYYNEHKEKIATLRKKSKNTYLSIDEVFDSLAGYATDYLTMPDGTQKEYVDQSHFWLIDEHFRYLFRSKLIKFSVYSKINEDKMRKALDFRLREQLLTAPVISSSLTFKSSQTHPMLQ